VNKGTTQVTHDFAGLSPSTTYTFRIGATYSGFGILGGAEPLNEVAFSSEPNPSITTEPLFPPTAEDLAVTDITGTSAHLSGKVDPHAPAGPLNEAAKKAFATHWEFVCTPECKDANGNVIGGTIQGEEGAQTVSGDVKRLEPDTPYEVSLIISSEGGGETVVETFKTLKSPPSVKQAPGASDGEGGYTLQGVVNPNNETITDCKFEWGPDSAKYAFSADCSPLSISGSKPITVEAHLTGLNPDVDYHALLVVTYGAGSEAKGVDQTFKATLNQPEPCPANEQLRKENSSLALPECRAYEMVTPPGKEGFDAVLWGYDQDDRVLFYSNAGNIARSGQGYSNNRYVAARSAAGWETIPDLNGSSGSIYDAPSNIHIPNGPPAVPIKYSADLLSSIWFTNKIDSLMQNYYLRGQDGTFNLIGKGGLSGDRGGYSFQIGGASDDLSHLLITSNDIVGDGVSPPWGPGVYEFLGTGNEQDPRRVDLDNSGSPISTCSGLPRSNGIQAGAARAAFISRDGRVVLVRVAGGCGGANPPAVGIWARIGGTVSVDVSASRCNRTAADPGGSCNAPAEATFESATPDGSRIFFTTKQQLVNGDTDETNDIYACDIPPGTSAPVGNANPCSALMQVSAGDSGGAAVENVATTSDDGSTALFAAKGVLAGNEDALGEAPVAGDHNLYAWHQDSGHPAGQTTFLGRLGSNDIGAQSTPDGRYVVFTTAARLLSTDTDDARDVYRYDVVTGELTRVSTNVFGVGGNGPGFGAAISARPSFSPVNPSSTTSHPTASDDGQSIIFTTAEALSPADGNGEPDVYLWTPDRVSLISTGSVGGGVNGGDLPGNLAFITASGRDIYFQTRGALTPADGDSLVDVYDARLDGGFSFAPAATCSGEACQATPTSSSSTAPSPANRLGGEGNPKPKVCPKGKVVKGDKCMKKQPKKNKGKHHKHHKHHKGKHHKGNGKGRQPASSDHWGGK
jgi:hypothetical protein